MATQGRFTFGQYPSCCSQLGHRCTLLLIPIRQTVMHAESEIHGARGEWEVLREREKETLPNSTQKFLYKSQAYSK